MHPDRSDSELLSVCLLLCLKIPRPWPWHCGSKTSASNNGQEGEEARGGVPRRPGHACAFSLAWVAWRPTQLILFAIALQLVAQCLLHKTVS